MPFVQATAAMGRVLAEHHAHAPHVVTPTPAPVKAKRGDVAVFERKTSTSYINGPTETHTSIDVGEVTSATRDGQVKEWRDYQAGAPIKVAGSGHEHAHRYIIDGSRVDKAKVEDLVRSRGILAGPDRAGFGQSSGTWESPKGSLLTQVENVDTAHLANMYEAETEGDTIRLGELRRQAEARGDNKTVRAFELGYRNPRTPGYRPFQSLEEVHAALKPHVRPKGRATPASLSPFVATSLLEVDLALSAIT